MAWVGPSVALLKKVDHFFPRKRHGSSASELAEVKQSILSSDGSNSSDGERRKKLTYGVHTAVSRLGGPALTKPIGRGGSLEATRLVCLCSG